MWFLVLHSKHNSRVGNLWGTLAGDLSRRLMLLWPEKEPLAPLDNSSVWAALSPVSVPCQHWLKDSAAVSVVPLLLTERAEGRPLSRASPG